MDEVVWDSLPCRTSLRELPDPKELAHIIEAGDPTNGTLKDPQEAKPTAMHIEAKAGAERIQAGE